MAQRGVLFVILVVCMACAASARPSADLQLGKLPWFCHGLNCPTFTIIKSTDAYEARYYESGVWASVDVQAYAFALATPQGFRKLFAYIDGGNKDGVKIPMTSPVLVNMKPSCGPFCKENFTVSFFVPFEFHDDPPEPLDDAIYIRKSKPFTVFVAQSGGFLVDDYSIARMANSLTDALDAEGVEYNDKHFYVAGYDPPFRLSGRHNEIWVKAVEAQPDMDSSLARA